MGLTVTNPVAAPARDTSECPFPSPLCLLTHSKGCAPLQWLCPVWCPIVAHLPHSQLTMTLWR